MSRYRAASIGLAALSLVAVGWLVFVIVDYSTAAFDCDLPGLYGPACADAARSEIASKAVRVGGAIIVSWCLGLWLFIQERKKQ
jgi:hypothetical protein